MVRLKRVHVMRGERLREVRLSRGLSQRDLAARCGMGEHRIWAYENGQSDPSAENLTLIAKELEVSVDYLLGLVENPDGHLREEDLSPMERRLINAVRRGLIVEALETFTALSKGENQADIPVE